MIKEKNHTRVFARSRMGTSAPARGSTKRFLNYLLLFHYKLQWFRTAKKQYKPIYFWFRKIDVIFPLEKLQKPATWCQTLPWRAPKGFCLPLHSHSLFNSETIPGLPNRQPISIQIKIIWSKYNIQHNNFHFNLAVSHWLSGCGAGCPGVPDYTEGVSHILFAEGGCRFRTSQQPSPFDGWKKSNERFSRLSIAFSQQTSQTRLK